MKKYLLAKSGNSNERVHDSMERLKRRVEAIPPGACPLTVELALLQTSSYQTCGKCVPCRDGLPQLAKLLHF